MFLVIRQRSGPLWNESLPLEQQSGWAGHAAYMDELVAAGFIVLGGPLQDERRVAFAVEADSLDAVRDVLASDPWHDTHLRDDTIDAWTIRLDGRRAT